MAIDPPFDLKSLTVDSPWLFCEDAIQGSIRYIPDQWVDLIITDPPYGIEGHTLHKHYNRDESYVIDGYVDIPKETYQIFSNGWIQEAERILKPGGVMYVVTGYTNLFEVLSALRSTSLLEINHIIWKYNFGVFTKNKFVTSHYHILYYVKPGKKPFFNTNARYGYQDKDDNHRSHLYRDLEDVWVINREYKPGKIKNKNELPFALLTKMMVYSSQENDVVLDFFAGSFSTIKIAKGLNRRAIGFEINPSAFTHQEQEVQKINAGEYYARVRQGNRDHPKNQGKSWTQAELGQLNQMYQGYTQQGYTKRDAILLIGEQFGRGRFAITNALKKISLANSQ